jgi:hypothetical protein
MFEEPHAYVLQDVFGHTSLQHGFGTVFVNQQQLNEKKKKLLKKHATQLFIAF